MGEFATEAQRARRKGREEGLGAIRAKRKLQARGVSIQLGFRSPLLEPENGF